MKKILFRIFKQGSLALASYPNTEEYGFQEYTELMHDFKKIGNATPPSGPVPSYNCLAFAVGETTWEDVPPSESELDIYMGNHGYEVVGYYDSNVEIKDGYIVAYKKDQSIGHFARCIKGVMTAKLGYYELVQHGEVEAYYSESIYGVPYKCYKPQS